MSKSGVAATVAVLGLLVLWIVREESRGTFDAVERVFLSWLVSNSEKPAPLPPLTLVVYDEEASVLSGEGRLGVLDASLFARAASRLGAVAVGIEGLSGDVVRVVEAARGTRVFGGFDLGAPPEAGWTPMRGEPGRGWRDVPGLVGLPGRFARGFIPSTEDLAGGRDLVFAGRCGGRAVPSFLLLAWASARGWRATDLTVDDGGLHVPSGHLAVGRAGAVGFLGGAAPRRMTLNDLLVAGERFEREGVESPVRGHVLVLARATPEVTRLATPGSAVATPVELCLRVWEPLREGLVFVRAGWWYGPLLWLAACALAFGPVRRKKGAVVSVGVFAVMLYLLAALGAFAGAALFLPLAPGLLTMVAGLGAALLARETSARSKRSIP